MVVVKLGGSLAARHDLRGVLATLAGVAGARVVLVPGGGPFADAVRVAQEAQGFDDGSAHHMALLAMEQYGVMLCALHPRLSPWRAMDELQPLFEAGRVPVWCPADMVLADTTLAASWDVTSDTLALRLARLLDARRLVLVKSCPVPAPPYDLTQLALDGIVDRAFPCAAKGWTGEVCLRDAGDGAMLGADLRTAPGHVP